MTEATGDNADGTRVFQISREAAEHLYQFMRLFWEERSGQDMDDASIESLLEGYRAAMGKPHLAPIRDTIVGIRNQVRNAGLEFSILELGAANGSIMHVLKDTVGLEGTRYFGMEPWQPFVEDFSSHFPDQTMIRVNIDDALELLSGDLRDSSFNICLACLVFCMIDPTRVRKFINLAAKICDCFIIYDINLNVLGDPDDEKVQVFPFNPEMIQFYFANPFDQMLKENGFKIAGSWDMPAIRNTMGWKTYLAVKANL